MLGSGDTVQSKKDKDPDLKQLIFKVRRQEYMNYSMHKCNSYTVVSAEVISGKGY